MENRFLWVKTTPLGTPVDPEVYIMMAASSLVGQFCKGSTEGSVKHSALCSRNFQIVKLRLDFVEI